MKPFLTLSIALFAPIALSAQSVSWVERFGANSFDRGHAVATDAAGNSYITGYFRNTVAFGSTNLSTAGGADIFVAKLDPSGAALWAVRAGSAEGLDQGNAIGVDAAGNCYVAGQFSGTATFGTFTLTAVGNTDLFIAKLGPSGQFVWVKGLGGSAGDSGRGIAVDADGNSHVTGAASGTVTFGDHTLNMTSSEVFITKLDSDGDFQWARSAGGAAVDEGLGIALDLDGNCFVTGVFSEASWIPSFTATFGSTTLTSSGGDDVFVTKLGPSGDFLWARSIGGPANDGGYGVTADAAGNCIVTGHFRGTVEVGTIQLSTSNDTERDVFVAKYDPTGDVLWAQRAGGTADDGGYGIVTDAAGNCYVAGAFGGTATFGTFPLTVAEGGRVFITKMGPDGAFLWVRAMGASPNEVGNGRIAMDAAGNCIITGWFRGAADFGGTTLTAAGSNDDIFVLKLAGGPVSVGEWGGLSNVLAYPNPASAMLRIQTEERVLAVDIHNTSGALVRTEARAVFSVEQLPAGLYLLRVRTDKGVSTLRLVKE